MQRLPRAAAALLRGQFSHLQQTHAETTTIAIASASYGTGRWSSGQTEDAQHEQHGLSPAEAKALHTRLSAALQAEPDVTARAIAASLSPAQRAILAAALNAEKRELEDERYVQELFNAADHDGDRDGRLTQTEFKHALDMHRALDGSNVKTPPDWSALRMVFLASAIPFVAFGFLDNSIMLVAGEEIDDAFGKRLGLSTLASAGLGNLVADAIGVGAASSIEQAVRKLPFMKAGQKLSKHQLALECSRYAKFLGATAGVMVGCVLGLAPLLLTGTFYEPGGRT